MMTLTELKAQAAELGLTPDRVRTFGKLTLKQTWINAIAVLTPSDQMAEVSPEIVQQWTGVTPDSEEAIATDSTLEPTSKQSPTCATCPYFRDYHEKDGRGYCSIFSNMTKARFPQTKSCDDEIAYQESRGIAVVLPPIDSVEESPGFPQGIAGDSVAIALRSQPNPKASSLNFSLTGFRKMVCVTGEGKRYPIAANGDWCGCPATCECYHQRELRHRLSEGLPLATTLPPSQKTTFDYHAITPGMRRKLRDREEASMRRNKVAPHPRWAELVAMAERSGIRVTFTRSQEIVPYTTNQPDEVVVYWVEVKHEVFTYRDFDKAWDAIASRSLVTV